MTYARVFVHRHDAVEAMAILEAKLNQSVDLEMIEYEFKLFDIATFKPDMIVALVMESGPGEEELAAAICSLACPAYAEHENWQDEYPGAAMMVHVGGEYSRVMSDGDGRAIVAVRHFPGGWAPCDGDAEDVAEFGKLIESLAKNWSNR